MWATLKENPIVRMMSRMRFPPQRFLHLVLILTIVLVIPASQSYPNGVGEVANDGCVCHGVIRETTELIVEGLPTKYESNTSYNLTLKVNGAIENQTNSSAFGGFRMLVSHGEITLENISRGQLLDGGWTHSEEGNKFREWNFTWTSPMDNTSYVEFKIFGNAVNGNDNPYGDEWNSLLFKLPGVENNDELKNQNNLYEFELYEKVILASVSLVIIILAYRAIK